MSMRHRQQAATIVSFALIAPVFLFIIFGIMEMGRVLNAWMVITNEAREAARYGAVTFDGSLPTATALANEQTTIRAYVQQRLDGQLAASGVYRQPDVQLVPSGANQSPLVQVTIYYQVPLVIPIVSQMLPNPFPIAARSAMRGE
jgi:Flp pilus assembly protein TadG